MLRVNVNESAQGGMLQQMTGFNTTEFDVEWNNNKQIKIEQMNRYHLMIEKIILPSTE